jgi:hypothetical protein
MMKVQEIRDWLDSLAPTDQVAIDEGGLALILVDNPEVHIEVGGDPGFDPCSGC